jgi:hypothetical protein
MLDWGLRFVSWVDKRGGEGRQVVKSCLSVLIVGWKSGSMDYF